MGLCHNIRLWGLGRFLDLEKLIHGILEKEQRVNVHNRGEKREEGGQETA